MKLIKLVVSCFCIIGSFLSLNASAAIFGVDGQITNIRQSAGTTLQINHTGVVGNNCSTKNYAYAISTDHPNFKNILASVLTAKASGSTVQFAAFDNQCISGFPEVDVFTIK